MIRIFNHFIPTSLLVLCAIEALLLGTSVSIGAAVRFGAEAGGPTVDLTWPTCAFIAVMLAVMGAFGLYSADLPAERRAMVVRVSVSFLAGLCVMSIVFYLVPEFFMGRGVFAISWAVALALTILVRLAFLRYWARIDLLAWRVLVLGTGRWASILEGLERTPRGGHLCIVGFVPVLEDENHVSPTRILTVDEPISAVVRKYSIDEVVIAVGDRRGGKLPVQELLECKLDGVEVTELASFYERERGQLRIDSMTTSWMVFGEGFRQNRHYDVIKTAFDLTASAVLLVVSLPVMVLTALCILIDDGPPVFYRQQRVGRSGHPFEILKFRSMRKDAEKEGQATWAQPGDQRITRVGCIIRTLRIDELPQVINVLRGEMSFVGPRPERPCFVSELSKQIPYYAVRHSVKPGITGWAQVRYPYSASLDSATEKLQFDLYYVKNHTLFLDLVIALETIGVVLWGKGAR